MSNTSATTGRFARRMETVLAGAILGGVALFISGLAQSARATSPYLTLPIDGSTAGQAGSTGDYSVAIQPTTGLPAVATVTASGLSVALLEFDGSQWQSEFIAHADSTIGGVSLAYDPVSGEPRVAFAPTTGGVCVALRDSGGAWTVETLTSAHYQPHHLHLLIPPSGSPIQVIYAAFASKTSYGDCVFYGQRTAPGRIIPFSG